MKKIYTKAVYQYDKETDQYKLIEEDFFWHSGEIAFAKGGAGGGSAPAQTTTVQKADPWGGQQPYLTDIFVQAQNQWTSPGPKYFQDSTVVPFSPETETALQFQAQRALQGSPLQSAANQQLIDTLNGNYTFGNPGFEEAVNATNRRITPQIQSAFNKAGRTGSGLAQHALGQAYSDSYAGLYNNERQRMQQANFFAPQMLQQDYVDAAKLAEVGAQREALSGEYLQDAINRYNYEQNLPAMKLARYSDLVQGNYGGTSISETTGARASGGSRSPLGGILGGAMMGGGSFGLPGAIVGGLLGAII